MTASPMLPVVLLVLHVLVPLISATFTVDCLKPIVIEQTDPIVSPGMNRSDHLHVIAGSNAFSKDSLDGDYLRSKTTCTTCNVVGDNSAYWIPQLYGKWTNGSAGQIPLFEGGVHVYYKFLDFFGDQAVYRSEFYAGRSTIVPFSDNFRMVYGNKSATSPPTGDNANTIVYKCHDRAEREWQESASFPSKLEECVDGLRALIIFPSCWNGADYEIDSTHVVQPVGGWEAGNCPSTHNKRIMTLFYEFDFDVAGFIKASNGRFDGLRWSNGDETGYGLHGDFLNGWTPSVLSKVVAECRGSFNCDKIDKTGNYVPLLACTR